MLAFFLLWVSFFFLERIGTVLCSQFKEIGTNTLTGWDGTELLTCCLVDFPVDDCSPGRESGTLVLLLFSP